MRFAEFCDLLVPKNPPKYIQQLIKKKFFSIPEKSRLTSEEVEDLKLTIEKVIRVEMDLEMIRFRITSIEGNHNEELPL